MKNTLLKILMLPILAIVMTGCATSAAKQAATNIRKAGKVYGEVVEVSDAASNSHVTRSCRNVPTSVDLYTVCQHLSDYDAATTVVLRKSQYIRGYATVPKSTKVKQGYILQVEMPENTGSIMRFERVAATAQSDSCKWDGPDIVRLYNAENSAGAAVAGFVAGALIIPGAAYLATRSSNDGGVICEGWSYQSLLGSN